MFSLSIRKVLIKPAIAWQWLYVGYPILHDDTRTFNGVQVFCRSIFPLQTIRYKAELVVPFRICAI